MYGVVPPLTPDAVIVIGWPSSKVFVAAGVIVVGALSRGLTVIVFATALNVTGVFALSTATTLNVTDPPMLFEVAIKSELNAIVPSELATIVLYVIPGIAFTPLICIGKVFDTNIRFAVIGSVPPEINTLYVTYWPESSIVLLGVRDVAVGAVLTVIVAPVDVAVIVGVAPDVVPVSVNTT